MQKMNTSNMDPFAEQCTEHHFSILQMCTSTNKEKADATQVRKEMYLKKKQCDRIHSGPLPRPRGTKDENQHGRFYKTMLRTPFQHSTNMYMCK